MKKNGARIRRSLNRLEFLRHIELASSGRFLPPTGGRYGSIAAIRERLLSTQSCPWPMYSRSAGMPTKRRVDGVQKIRGVFRLTASSKATYLNLKCADLYFVSLSIFFLVADFRYEEIKLIHPIVYTGTLADPYP
ncbi:hypothetical protein D3C81_518290 [compost metagenome]